MIQKLVSTDQSEENFITDLGIIKQITFNYGFTGDMIDSILKKTLEKQDIKEV